MGEDVTKNAQKDMNKQYTFNGKLLITSVLTLETGLHIGASSDFAPIGAVDSPVIRDVITQKPIIPGSSLKGKMRTLLARCKSDGYLLPAIDKDNYVIKRLFGAGGTVMRPGRLQFFDLAMTDESFTELSALPTDTYLGEIKFENTINRVTATANPRQIERVPAGTSFNLKLVYNIERAEKKEQFDKEFTEDIEAIALGFEALSYDYLGGHGSRGYGRVKFSEFKVTPILLRNNEQPSAEAKRLQNKLNGKDTK